MEYKTKWLLCPICKNKTRIMLREDTVMKNFVLYCPKCRQEHLIDVNKGNIKISKEPDAMTQSQSF